MRDTRWEQLAVDQLTDNVFKVIGKDWMLITAGNLQKYNTMTASWGGIGILWGKPVAFCFVRPTRYTYEFMEQASGFTLSFFDETFRSALTICGSKSGREIDKAAVTGLKAVEVNSERVSFEQARLVLECTKLYYQDLDPAHFLDPGIAANYPDLDYHRMYVGEITHCYKQD